MDISDVFTIHFHRNTPLQQPVIDPLMGQIGWMLEFLYLNEQEQYDLLEQMELNDCTPSLSQACRFKKISQEDGLTPETIAEIMSEEKANQREMFKVPMERIRKYVPAGNPKQAEDFVLKACEHYHRFLIRQRNRDER